MKILVIQGHPDDESFVAACARTYIGAATNARHEVRSINLAEEAFDPVLRYGYRKRMSSDAFIESSQELLSWAEHIVVCFPVWWAAEPSLLKGWWDRVLTPRFAYQYVPGKVNPLRLLTGKTASLIATSHAPGLFVRLSPAYPVRRLKKHVLGYCGIKVVSVSVLGGMEGSQDTPQKREDFLARIVHEAEQLK